MKKIITLFFKYCVYYPTLLLRKEWIWCHVKQLSKSQYIELNQLERIQLNKINQLLAVARTSEFYKKKFTLKHIKSLDQMPALGFIEKEDLRDNQKALKTRKYYRFFTRKTSGGSTGAPVSIDKPASAMAKELAATWRGYSWANITIGQKQARFWGVPLTRSFARRAKLIDLVARRIRFSAFKFSDSDLDSYVNILEKEQPDYFYGYASMLNEVAVYILRNGLSPRVSPTAIITTSEVLTSATRHNLETAFSCKVYNEYGCGEVGTIAHECEFGNMHVNMENVIIEIVDENEQVVAEGISGEIVVTDLNNDMNPLIRYKLKDYGSLSSRACECGRKLLILENLKGRAYDFLVNDQGKKFHGEFFLYIIEELKTLGISLRAIQFIGSATEVEIKISSDMESFGKAKDYITKKLTNQFSSSMDYVFTNVSQIPREASGKLRVIKSII